MQYEKEVIMMIAGIGKLLARNIFSNGKEQDGIVRMFEVEYAKEYRNARRAGVHIDRQFVEDFLKTTK
jgi:hypothetical protein